MDLLERLHILGMVDPLQMVLILMKRTTFLFLKFVSTVFF